MRALGLEGYIRVFRFSVLGFEKVLRGGLGFSFCVSLGFQGHRPSGFMDSPNPQHHTLCGHV